MSTPKKPFQKAKVFKYQSIAAFGLLMMVTQTASANAVETVENGLRFGQSDAKYGQVKFNLNYRYEYADTENTAREPAHANTFRLRLGYLTPEFSGIQGYAEYENVFAV